jgi:serine/threonine protein kinase
VDLWALGVTLAEFFRPLRISFEDEQADDSDDERPATKSEDPSQRFVTPPGIEPRADADWAREALFDADNGEIALVWSIFQVRGTPTEATWPVRVAQFFSHVALANTWSDPQGFFDLPNARRIQFREAVPVRLRDRLPNLPSMALSALDTSTSGEEDMIDRLLAYPPEQRLRAEDALQHAWFRESAPLLPVEMYGGRETTNLSGRTLAEIMQIFLPLAP